MYWNPWIPCQISFESSDSRFQFWSFLCFCVLSTKFSCLFGKTFEIFVFYRKVSTNVLIWIYRRHLTYSWALHMMGRKDERWKEHSFKLTSFHGSLSFLIFHRHDDDLRDCCEMRKFVFPTSCVDSNLLCMLFRPFVVVFLRWKLCGFETLGKKEFSQLFFHQRRLLWMAAMIQFQLFTKISHLSFRFQPPLFKLSAERIIKAFWKPFSEIEQLFFILSNGGKMTQNRPFFPSLSLLPVENSIWIFKSSSIVCEKRQEEKPEKSLTTPRCYDDDIMSLEDVINCFQSNSFQKELDDNI